MKVTWTVSVDIAEDEVDAAMTIDAASSAFFATLGGIGVEYKLIEESTKPYDPIKTKSAL